jgi:hypothetical protein
METINTSTQPTNKLTLSQYINQYQGHTRFLRLHTMIDRNPFVRAEAI